MKLSRPVSVQLMECLKTKIFIRIGYFATDLHMPILHTRNERKVCEPARTGSENYALHLEQQAV